jgi:hypothetical protein
MPAALAQAEISTREQPPQGRAASRLAPRASFAKASTSLVVAFFLLLNGLFLLTSSGRVRTMDEVMPDLQAESLSQQGTTAVPQAVRMHLFFGKMDRFGRPQAAYLPGQAVAALPWNLMGHYWSRRLAGVPAPARDMFNAFATVASNATFSALAAALALAFFLATGIAPRTALAAAFMFALATPLFAYSAWFYSESMAAALLVAAALALFGGPAAAAVSSARAAIAGLCLGAAVWLRPPHVLVVSAFLAALLLSARAHKWRAAMVASSIVAAAVVLLLWRNADLFGQPFDFGYPPVAEAGRQNLAFAWPWRGLVALLLSPGKSLFLFTPPAVLALYGARQLWRRDRGIALLTILAPLVYLGFYACYQDFEGGYSFGPRYLLPAAALLCLALGAALRAATPAVKKLALAVFAAGLLVNSIGMATSFLEAQVGAYYDAQYRYQMDYSPLTRQTRLFFHYLTTPGPAPIGLGFDRWWIILSKVGISGGTLLTIAAVELIGLLAATFWLIASLRKFPSASHESSA